MKSFFVKNIVTRSLKASILMILGVSILFFLIGFIPLYENNKLVLENWLLLINSTLKFSMWFFIGYGGFQAMGVRFEANKLKELEDDKYLAHARAELDSWTQMSRDTNTEETLAEIEKIDNQRFIISGDEITSIWLFGIGCTLFVITSVFEQFNLA